MTKDQDSSPKSVVFEGSHIMDVPRVGETPCKEEREYVVFFTNLGIVAWFSDIQDMTPPRLLQVGGFSK